MNHHIPLPIQPFLNDVTLICKEYKVHQMYLFGSVLTDHFNAESDLDILVSFYPIAPETYVDNLFDFRDKLEALFQRKVDLVEVQALKNPYFKHVIDQTKQLIYEGRQGAKMAA